MYQFNTIKNCFGKIPYTDKQSNVFKKTGITYFLDWIPEICHKAEVPTGGKCN